MEDYKKKILANDLCGRLEHNVVVRVGTAYDIANNITEDATLKGIEFNDPYFGTKALVNVKTNSGSTTFGVAVEDVKPYLRPWTSMTKEEKDFIRNKYFFEDWDDWTDLLHYHWHQLNIDEMPEFMDWLNSHHFDYRGLIKKGLALEAPEGMYN